MPERIQRKRVKGVSIPHWFDSKLKLLNPLKLIRFRFNSTLVRFKGTLAPEPEPLGFSFNSTLVRFKGYFAWSLAHSIAACFNSTLVRFKGSTPRRCPVCRWRFQFHIGSIQSQQVARAVGQRVDVSIPHWFDSKLVVLRGVAARRVGFNSTLVRFKAATSWLLQSS